MHALIVLALSLACANAYVPYAYHGYAGYGYPGYAPAAYTPYAYAAPVEVEEKAVEVAPYTHLAAPYAYTPYTAPYVAPYAHHAPAHVPTYASQYHSQDEYGQASYGYAQPGQAKSEVRDHYGNVAGSYYYINPEGKRVEVSYTAGVDGFKVHSNDLPVAPVYTGVAPESVQDTPEVAAARAAHLAIVANGPVVSDVALPVAPVYTGVAPEAVQDTPEVVEARAAHLAAVAKAKEAHRRKRSVAAVHHGFPYSRIPYARGFGYSFAYPTHGYAHHGYAHHGYAHPGYARLGYAHLGYGHH